MPNTATTQLRRISPGYLVTAECKVKPGLDVDDSFFGRNKFLLILTNNSKGTSKKNKTLTFVADRSLTQKGFVSIDFTIPTYTDFLYVKWLFSPPTLFQQGRAQTC